LFIIFIFSEFDVDVKITNTRTGMARPAQMLSSPGVAAMSVLSSPTAWLDDGIIDHAQAMLRQQFPTVSGLFATGSITLLGSPPELNTKFVQILHLGGNHWVTASNIGCPKNSVNIFDSLSPQNNHTLSAQVASFLKCKDSSIRMVWPHFQRQSGYDDCGLFAIASAYELCRGEDPTLLKFQQVQMRAHLMSCYFNGNISSFQSTARRPHHPVKMDNIRIFCSCRRPFRAKVENMVECSSCKEWFHDECEGINLRDFTGKGKNRLYVCSQC
jgi:hypothetical protein